MNKTYAQKLQDPRWQQKRLLVFNRDNWKCIECGNEKLQLEVHHESYIGDPWDAPIETLTTLCNKCHSAKRIKPEKLGASVKNSTQYISPSDERFKFVDAIIVSLYNKINASKNIVSKDELRSLKNELNAKLWDRGLVIVDAGVSYGLM